jgi:hypothetical protein
LALVGIGITSLLAGCSDERSPTEPGRVAESVTVGGARTLTEGETVPLVATVRWSTGANETVTDGVTWVSDDPRIASVDQRGVVTALAPGETRIRATVNTVSGTTALRIVAGIRTLNGLVHESWPTEQKSIAGATVTAVDAAGNAQSAVTDSSGRFTLRLAPGIAQITVAAPGYETTTASADPTAGTELLSLSLPPVMREVRESFAYISPAPATFIDQRRFRINVHHAGEVRAEYTGSYADASSHAHLCLQIRDSSNRVLARSRGAYDIAPSPIRLDVVPGVYDVSFFSCNPFGGPQVVSLAWFSGAIKHPN